MSFVKLLGQNFSLRYPEVYNDHCAHVSRLTGAHHYPPKFLSNMPKIPTHDVYFVVKKSGTKDGKKQRDVWTKIGAAWMHSDNKGFDVIFELMPYELLTDKRVVLREREEKVIT